MAAGEFVGRAEATDVDVGDSLRYEFADGSLTSGLFEIDPNTGDITTTGALDFETAQSHTLDVVVHDRITGGLTDTATVNVAVGNDPSDDVNIVNLYDLDASDTQDEIVNVSATTGVPDIFVYDFTQFDLGFDRFNISNWNPTEDTLIIINADFDQDGSIDFPTDVRFQDSGPEGGLSAALHKIWSVFIDYFK